MAKQVTMSVVRCLETAASDVEGLHEEMSEWQSNLEGANMDHLEKYERVSDCASTLENADLNTYVEHLTDALDKAGALGFEFEQELQFKVSTAKKKSRADRLGEVCEYLSMALDHIEAKVAEYLEERKKAEAKVAEYLEERKKEEDRDDETEEDAAEQEKSDALEEVESTTADVRNAWDELCGVEFPGMYG